MDALLKFYWWDNFPNYNFMILNDGNVYEGRGFNNRGLAIDLGSDYDQIGISVAFCGQFNDTEDYDRHIKSFNNFLRQSVETNDIADDYRIFLRDQLNSPYTASVLLPDVMRNWDRFYNCELKIEC